MPSSGSRAGATTPRGRSVHGFEVASDEDSTIRLDGNGTHRLSENRSEDWIDAAVRVQAGEAKPP